MKEKNNAKIALVVALFWSLVFYAIFGPEFALALFIPTALFAFVMLCVITVGVR